MKKILFIILLLIGFSVYSQKKNIYVQYNAVIHDEVGLYGENNFLRKSLLNAIESEISFGLIINTEGSKFYNESIIGPKESDSLLTLKLFVNYMGVVYTINDSILTNQEDFGPDNYTYNPAFKDWKLSKEVKTINGYKCYKGTTVYEVKIRWVLLFILLKLGTAQISLIIMGLTAIAICRVLF